MNHASTPPSVYGEGANRPLYYDVTHACGAQPHARRSRHTRLPMPPHARDAWGGAAHEGTSHGKNRPACPHTVFGLAQRRDCAYVWPRPGGLLSVYKKRGTLFCTPITVH